jgi:hypothetical protein
MFVLFQFSLRRRILEFYYRLSRKSINRRLNGYSKNAISNVQFIKNLSDSLNIPNNINTNENEKNFIIREADKTLNGIYNLLGSGDV